MNTRESTFKSNLAGKVVLVTGSTAGLGRELAAALLRAGARVVINGRDRERLMETKEELAAGGRQVISVQGDVTSAEDCREMIGKCIKEFGKLDILINNAGVGSCGPFMDTIPEAHRNVLETNLFGSIYPTYYALPHVIESRGSIVFISSLAGIYGLPYKGTYSASKMALTSLTQTLRIELAGTGVHTGIMYVGVLKNDSRKSIINSQNRPVPAMENQENLAMSLEQASMKIIRSIEKRKKVTIFSSLGKLLYLFSRISPLFVRKVISLNIRKFERAYMPAEYS